MNPPAALSDTQETRQRYTRRSRVLAELAIFFASGKCRIAEHRMALPLNLGQRIPERRQKVIVGGQDFPLGVNSIMA